jgi:serine phosphatase RsbU (regulator of sigma subunit)/anti-sigma regulatory factor (Ser/Thr protein kinase)
MTTLLQYFRRAGRRGEREPSLAEAQAVAELPRISSGPVIEIAPNDPLVAYFLNVPGAAEIERLRVESPALEGMRAAGIQMVVPLVSQGELIGVISLGPRMSEQEYSSDDRGLLSNLSVQAAPALRVAQLVRQQQLEALQRERLAQELRVAQLVQQTLLPKQIPAIGGWRIDRYYQPAREVGGDFYDFINLPDGRLGLVIGDVTDKGVPAALVMATTRTILRAAAGRLDSPGAVLARANDVLVEDIPQNMFVTCLYAILDPRTGRLWFANAGHDLPYRYRQGGVDELRARGMPLGLMPGMIYEEKEIFVAAGEGVLFYSDGLVEAHNAKREMFSFGRLQALVAGGSGSEQPMTQYLLEELARFTGGGWEQEDDITMVLLEREMEDARWEIGKSEAVTLTPQPPTPHPVGWRTLADLALPSEPGNERIVMEQVGELVSGLGLPPRRLERLKTAVAEATMNAIEHGNQNRPELLVSIQVRVSASELAVTIVDQGGATPIAASETPDLYAKLEGEQSPRGWGLFLIKSMVDEMRVSGDERHHRIELIMHLEGASNAGQTA